MQKSDVYLILPGIEGEISMLHQMRLLNLWNNPGLFFLITAIGGNTGNFVFLLSRNLSTNALVTLCIPYLPFHLNEQFDLSSLCPHPPPTR